MRGMQRVSTRISRSVEGELKQRAKQNGKPLSEYIREVLTQHIEGESERSLLLSLISSLSEEVKRLGNKLAVGVEGILISNGKIGGQQASDWVNTKIRGL